MAKVKTTAKMTRENRNILVNDAPRITKSHENFIKNHEKSFIVISKDF